MIEHLTLFQIFEQEQFFYHQYYCKVQSPYYEVPCSAVPHSRKHPYNKNVEKVARLTYSVSAERNINIVAEP